MLTPKYKYTRKYIIEKVNKDKILYSFLKENRIYNRFINSCHKANTDLFFISRGDFYQQPFMAFSWAESERLYDQSLNWSNIQYKFSKYRKHIYEEI